MPIYEYECDACGKRSEVLQKLSESPLRYCPECGEESLRKLLSAPQFRLSGGGWYETDFKTGDKRNIAGDKKDTKIDKGDGKSTDKKPETSKEKPAPKSETKS